MKILFLGGTSFVGRHLAEATLAAGHEVVFFHRGLTGASLFPGQTHLRGDRRGDLAALARSAADVVIDTSGYTPDAVEASACAVEATVRRYIFMSSVDCYELSAPGLTEASPLRKLPPGATTSEIVPELYGAHKALCEARLCAVMGADRVVSLRAGLMFGPHDVTGRSTYWPVRVARGGEVLVPESRAMPVQLIDVRDVARFTVALLESEHAGAFNLVGDPHSLDFGDVLDACETASSNHPAYTWAPSSFLVRHDVVEWIDLPLWIANEPEPGFRDVRNDRARARGLTLRPLAETCRDILAEFRARDPQQPLKAGLDTKRETALLADLRRARVDDSDA